MQGEYVPVTNGAGEMSIGHEEQLIFGLPFWAQKERSSNGRQLLINGNMSNCRLVRKRTSRSVVFFYRILSYRVRNLRPPTRIPIPQWLTRAEMVEKKHTKRARSIYKVQMLLPRQRYRTGL